MRVRTVAISCLALAAYGCLDFDVGQSCTDIGCADGVSIALRHESEVWQDGEYMFRLEADDDVRRCNASIPADLPPLGALTQLACEPSGTAHLGPEVTCIEQRGQGAVTQSCLPIADRWVVTAELSTTPRTLRVAVTRDTDSLLSRTLKLKYKDEHPNGEDCDPVCQRSSVELTFD